MTTKHAQHSAWQAFADAHSNLVKARQHLMKISDGLVNTLSEAISDGDVSAVMHVAELLPQDDLKRLFPELLAVASSVNGQTDIAQRLILRIPKDWLKQNTDANAEPFLAAADEQADYETYASLLTLYQLIDDDLAIRLANRAAKHADEDLREVGEDALQSYGRL